MSALVQRGPRALASYAVALVLVTLALASPGCGGAQSGSRGGAAGEARESEIDHVRARAAARPDDPAAQRALAEWELLGEGGDPDRAEAAIARAEELAPDDVALAYLRGILLEQRGRPNEALDAFLAVLERTPQSDDPLVSVYVESTFAYIADVRTNAPRFLERARPAIEALVASPGRIGFPARRQGVFWLREAALQRGDVAEAARLEALVGCPSSARVAGPFGTAVLSGFDETLAGEGAGPLAERYDLGPGRGEMPTRTVEARRCHVPLGGRGDESGPGTRIAEATLRAESAGRYVLALVSSGSVQLRVDGEIVDRVDRRRALRGSTTFHVLDLSAGDHQFELKVSSRHASPSIGWMIDRAAPGYDPELAVSLPPDAESPAARFALLDVLALRRETIQARERLRDIGVSERSSAAMLSLAARIVSNDPFLTDTQREDDERRLVAMAAARDSHAVWPALRRAALETGAVESLAALREVADRFPQLATVQLALASALAEAGYHADADQAVARAAEAQPEACPVIEARYAAAAQRGRAEQAMPLARALIACDARDETLFDRALAAHDWNAARAELERLRPLLTPERARLLALSLARASGDTAAERRWRDEIEREAPAGHNVVVGADRRYVASDRAGALRLVRDEAARAPRHAHDLRRLEHALAGEDVMQPYRVDGREVIRRFEASGRAYEGESAVLVFDYMVTRIFEDGSALDLVHQIYRIQTQEGIERFSELRLGGRVLTVRAVSSDGRAREPDRVDSTTTLPPLSIGDYVEYEIVRDHAPQWGDGYVSAGWVFQNFAQPFDHSEMVFVAPASMDLRFDARGPVPAPETREQGGLRSYRFLMTEQRALTREPNAIPDPPILPSLRAGTRVTWDRMFEAVHDRMLDLDPEDPAARRLLAREILGGQQLPARVRVQRVHRWVMENIEPAENTFYESAPVMVAARAGNQPRVLRYLLELAGVPARIAFVRGLAGEPPSPDVPDTGTYDHVVVVADVEGSPLHLVAGGRGVPHDHLPAVLLGQEGVLLAPGLPRFRVPPSQGPRPALRVTADMAIEPTGRTFAHLTVAFAGAAGAELRDAILQIPQAERAQIVAERFTPSILPGAVGNPASLVLRGLDDWERDLEIELDTVSDGLLRGGRDAIHLVPLASSGIESNFARLPSRTTTELVGEVDVMLVLRVRGPGVPRPPQPGRVAGPAGASATLEVARDADGAIRLSRRVQLPMATIPVAQYEELARFCRAATELENRTVTFTAR